ncbi:Cytochrome bd-I ubiquinol oxidase subunit 2 [Paraburkholderia hiiakae]|uniref:Cytochrome bd-I ubiquinol oxidase subunit 2 n=1 Tax=Paraburkholderia hiiakae TaxID=1081782 RepID=A0ABN7HS54_9BURK|nr:cytochrome d ubiquinol oxidase subunit II [Paraburkholderia hiiakae]CAD6534099.1 Cytochrome bd-I ubiquinol oxidase subunit 2 [Paraburkholderia hiiakae]
MDVTVVWATIIAIGLFMYIVLDGFDLGVGMIFPFFPSDTTRDMLMHSIAPVWDGNETWLVLGGAALFAAFPMVYAVALSGLYLPVVFMLVCLIFRGVSFELRGKANRTKNLWNLAFICGSAGAAFFQGVILGAYLKGIPVKDGVFAGDPFFWVTPFGFFTGMGLMVTYALQGATYLVMKTEGELQETLYTIVWPMTLALLGFIVAVSVWTPLSDAEVAARWFSSAFRYRLYPVPILVAVTIVAMYRAVRRRAEVAPFVLCNILVLLGYIGLLISIWPYAIPTSVTLWEAASPRSSQLFALVGAVIIIPIILVYTTAGYWVFRGKVQQGSQYH